VHVGLRAGRASGKQGLRRTEGQPEKRELRSRSEGAAGKGRAEKPGGRSRRERPGGEAGRKEPPGKAGRRSRTKGLAEGSRRSRSEIRGYGGEDKVENKEPIRKKAQETRQRLMLSAMEVIAARGYHNVTVDEIAKEAGLSTGIAYRYFKNKKELLLAGLEYVFRNIREITGTQFEKLAEFPSMEEALSYALDRFYQLHTQYYGLHEELESLRHIDEDVKALYQQMTAQAVETLLQNCPEEWRRVENLRERIYAAIGILENYAHFQMEQAILDNKMLRSEISEKGADSTSAADRVDVGEMKSLAIRSVMALFR